MFWTRTLPVQGKSTTGSPLDFFNRVVNSNPFGHVGVDFPAFNIWADEEGVVLTSELPGVGIEDLDISVSGKNITVKGVRKGEDLGEKMTRVRHERPEGEFERSFKLPFTIESAKVTAALKDGVLRVSLPRAESEKPRKITVNG